LNWIQQLPRTGHTGLVALLGSRRQLARQGIQLAKAVRRADWQAKRASSGRCDPKKVQNLRIAILQSIQENLYRESPED